MQFYVKYEKYYDRKAEPAPLKEDDYCFVLQPKADCHDPLPVEILLAALEYRDSAEDMDKGRVNTFKLC